MKHIRIKIKMTLLTLLVLIGLVVLTAVTIAEMKGMNTDFIVQQEETIRTNYDQNIKQQVENAISLLDSVYSRYESGELTLSEARKSGADLLRDLRYGDNAISGQTPMMVPTLFCREMTQRAPTV